jgi:cephalosporin hydroxylase
MSDEDQRFAAERKADVAAMRQDTELEALSREWFDRSCRHRYSYNFTWMGRPIIQFPEDIVVMQELVWRVQPDVIVETGVAHGGSIVFYASLLELLGRGEVIGIDIEIRPHNRRAIEAHPMARRIHLIEGSSTDPETARQVLERSRGKTRALVVLDSNHTHEHVRRELELYSPLVRAGSYLVVFDTVVEDMPAEAFPDRPWGRGNNPKTAVREFLSANARFVVDHEVGDRMLLSVAPGGYLRCVADP